MGDVETGFRTWGVIIALTVLNQFMLQLTVIDFAAVDDGIQYIEQ